MAEPDGSSALVALDDSLKCQILLDEELDQQQQQQSVDVDLAAHDMDACFKAFDKDNDGLMTYADFVALCRTLFRNEQGKAYAIEENRMQEMFQVFDKNSDGYIDFQEFAFCWKQWIKPIVRPISALIVVDVQNDFISGSLAIINCPAQHNGQDVLKPINKMLESCSFDYVFYSLDWHPDNHISFIENIHQRKLHPTSPVTADDAKTYDTVVFDGPSAYEQKLWPKHCVQETWGAELHPAIKVRDNGIFVYKGMNPDLDSYSAFWDNNKVSQTPLYAKMRERKVTDLYVCGIAYDICVGATARHALEFGFRTILIDDACRGVSMENILNTRDNLAENNAVVVHSTQVKDMVEGRDRRPELGYFRAMQLRKAAENGVGRDVSPEDVSPRDQMLFLT